MAPTPAKQTNRPQIEAVLVDKICAIRLVIFDFDGVFTDNTVYVAEDGTEAVRCWRELGLPSISLNSQQCVYDAAEVMAWLERKLPRRAEQLRAWEAAR